MTQAVAAPWRRSIDGWELCSTAPGCHAEPAGLDADASVAWLSVANAGTVASMLRDAGAWNLDGAPRRFDAEDWWLRAHVEVDPHSQPRPTTLRLDGLAGLADVWVNGRHLLRSENMFVAHALPLRAAWRSGRNVIHLRFAALDSALTTRRARPRWRAPMIDQQQLRWFRQTLLGRAPGWTPPAAPVGPWRDAWFECADGPMVRDVDVHAGVADDGSGVVSIALCAAGTARRVELVLERAGRAHVAELQRAAPEATCWQGRLRIDTPARWWPHSHGEPALYEAWLRLWDVGGAALDWPLSPVGFRTMALDHGAGEFALQVNGVPVFCRGACWMPLDAVSLRAPAVAYRAALAQVREAGMNMLRVCGPTVYEDEAFFEACDAEGVLVWQDFMFANLDYPADDPAFAESVRVEAAQQLTRWRPHASLAVVCGNSEVEQQAAMWGAPRELWSPPLFHEVLRRWTADRLPGLPYWPSSAHGGAFPHQADGGTASYYGVGAYLRDPDDARRARVRFATECLGLANVPETATIARMPCGHALRVHHPAWKARTPRDLGAGWDFEDVRDHYLKLLFGVEPLQCRYADHERYLALSRAVSGELMAGAFSEWRRPDSGCRGALVWFLRDLWAGAGWGLLDDTGQPKACWHALRRTLQSRALLLTDEGGNGLTAHLINEPADATEAILRLDLYGTGETRVARAEHRQALAGRAAVSVALAGLFDSFFDLSYSYRFGPPAVSLVHAQWRSDQGACVAEAFHFPAGRPSSVSHETMLSASMARRDDGAVVLQLQALRFVQSLQIELDGWSLPDNHFHMAPGGTRELVLRPAARGVPPSARGWLRPLNAATPLALRLPS